MKRLARIRTAARSLILADKEGLPMEAISQKLQKRFGVLAPEEVKAIEDVYEHEDVASAIALVQMHPSKGLVFLLAAGCDGGMGEFEEYMPERLAKLVEEQDASFVPVLRKDGVVEWCTVTSNKPSVT